MRVRSNKRCVREGERATESARWIRGGTCVRERVLACERRGWVKEKYACVRERVEGAIEGAPGAGWLGGKERGEGDQKEGERVREGKVEGGGGMHRVGDASGTGRAHWVIDELSLDHFSSHLDLWLSQGDA